MTVLVNSQGEYHHSQGDHIVISGSVDCTFRIWSINKGNPKLILTIL
jgi:WD40 repeat protein